MSDIPPSQQRKNKRTGQPEPHPLILEPAIPARIYGSPAEPSDEIYNDKQAMSGVRPFDETINAKGHIVRKK